MRFTSILSVAAVLVASVAGHTAWGQQDDTTKQCVADAAAQYKSERTKAQDQFKIDKDVCRNRDPVCAEACRTTRDTCVDAAEGPVETCKDKCATDLTTARDACKALPEDSPEREACIDDAQVEAFRCRDKCRDNPDARAALRTCKTVFKECIQTCAASAPAP